MWRMTTGTEGVTEHGLGVHVRSQWHLVYQAFARTDYKHAHTCACIEYEYRESVGKFTLYTFEQDFSCWHILRRQLRLSLYAVELARLSLWGKYDTYTWRAGRG